MSEEEFVPIGVAIWNSDRAKNYLCPTCLMWIFSQHEGDDPPAIECRPNGHLLRFKEQP